MNVSALDALNKELNKQAKIREYLIEFTTRLPITTSDTILIQAKSLAQLTQATNQLTRVLIVRLLSFVR